jgi:predicted lipid-binding transport protein (Tim44 family)
MLKKLSLILMACTIAWTFTAPDHADAARSSYKSPKKSFNSGTTTQTPNSGINKNEPAASKSPASASTSAPAQKPGFFSGGGLMRGLMIGGMAGLLFGGLFGGMGFLGNMLGMMVNILAVVVLIAVIRKIFIYFRDRRNTNHQPRKY